MGKLEGWQQPNGLLLNGLMSSESSSVICVLDAERWSKAEERTSELIACIQPNQQSENRRNAVADYVQRLIMKCYSCQVFTFGSVPLKTYLPDGDIDLTAFSKNQALKDEWAIKVRDILKSEEKNQNAEFHVKEVQVIDAEVQIIKCLVENIVVDISFNQLGGLCTLCFLEEVDNLINQNHLFKRSIILIKAWCYYESRILGAHHGLISTYALETLVLYIFHVFNNSFAGPLEVLYRFLEFFSNFDWDNFCVSLWGPVPISSLPDVTAQPPRKDSKELLLNKLFLDACSSVYAVFPGGQEIQGHPFISKYFNVIDPLRVNNNLGRSVNKGNFYRIRSAFAFGAKRLARLLDCPKENIVLELNQFFTNTWERHGSGIRPDAPMSDLSHLQVPNPDHGSDNHRNSSSTKKSNENACNHEIEVEGPQNTRPLSSQRASYPMEGNDVNLNSSKMSFQIEKGNSNQSEKIDRSHRSSKPDVIVNEIQGKYLFSRTRSSPELTDAYCDAYSCARGSIKPAECGKSQVASVNMDSSRRKNLVSETLSTKSTIDDSNSISNSEDYGSVMGAQGMLQDEQDLINMMGSSSVHNFGGQMSMALNVASTHLPLPISQSVLASMGYAQSSMPGMVPTNIPMIDPHWVTNLQFQQGLLSSPLTQYFPGVGLSTNFENLNEHDNGYLHERDATSNGRFGPDDGSFEMVHGDDRHSSISTNFHFVPSSPSASSGSTLKAQQKSTKENRGSTREDYIMTSHCVDNPVNEFYSDDRVSSARFSSASQAGSVRSKTSSGSSWDGSCAKVSKVAREKRGRKTTQPPNIHGKGKDIYEHDTGEADDESSDWNTASTMGNEIDERSMASQNASTLRHVPDFDEAQMSAPMLLGPASRQRMMDNSGAIPYFYPTGPPVPFFTMLPVYNCPAEGGTSDASSSLLGEEGAENSDCGHNFDISEGHGVVNPYNSMRSETISEALEEPKRDILNSDFTSHWQNLQYGRFCQSPCYHPAPVICPPPVAVPPMYLEGHLPWDGPGRPLVTNANLLSQLMRFGPRLVPTSNRPIAVYQRYVDELPRYRSGTGTYLPNPKATTIRDRHSSGSRRNNYNYDRSDHGDREGNWNKGKPRAPGRVYNRSQADKSRIDRLATNEDHGDRPWGTQNGPLRPSPSQSSSSNVAYGMYPLNPSGLSSNGPSVVMLYPYGHNSGYVAPGEQLEFGSLGPVGFIDDGNRVRGAFEDQRFHGNSTQQSSPDQPSSPHFQRRI